MSQPAVHWQEGMFLQPHHLQAATRHAAAEARQQSRWDNHYNWGLRVFRYDRDALANSQLIVRALEARLRDGTGIVLADGDLPALDLKPAFGTGRRAVISLALPPLRLGQMNASADAADAPRCRWRVESQDLPDENTADGQETPLAVRRLNARLLSAAEDAAGYEMLPVIALERSARGDGLPVPDAATIPPVLACDAWPTLQNDILQAVFNRLGKKIDLQAGVVASRGLTLDSRGQGDAMRVAQLDRLNAGAALLAQLAFVPGIHPLPAYLELCRLVGSLAVFGPSRRAPELPRYDHDDLGRCFWAVKRQVDAMLDEVDEPVWEEAEFVGAGLSMQVSLKQEWLSAARDVFIGVKNQLGNDECIRLLTRTEQLGMKVGSSRRVEKIFAMAAEGLRFKPCPRAPVTLPSAGVTYFQLERETPMREWTDVVQTLTLAIRMKEGLIAGNIDGQRQLAIRYGGQTEALEFTLYVVPTEPPAA